MNSFLNNTEWITPVIDNYYLEPYALFIKLFNQLPQNAYISNFDLGRGYDHIKANYAELIDAEYHKSNLDCNTKKEVKDRILLVMKNEAIFELGTNYCDIFYGNSSHEMVDTVKAKLLQYKKKSRNAQQEINIIAKGDGGLELMEMEVKRATLDLDLYYPDDLKEVDAVIRKRLNKPNDKGIILLHGIPGTGKTTYLRYIIGKIKKKILFVPPNIAGQIADPDLIKLLIENPDCVLIIEDAENIIMQRSVGHESSVANLLNISDGLLSDFLNVQIICTFNSSLSMIDDALLRKGRLIAKYEFKKLPIDKAQKLSDKLGYNNTIGTPQSLAELFNQDEKTQESTRMPIGFRPSFRTGH